MLLAQPAHQALSHHVRCLVCLSSAPTAWPGQQETEPHTPLKQCKMPAAQQRSSLLVALCSAYSERCLRPTRQLGLAILTWLYFFSRLCCLCNPQPLIHEGHEGQRPVQARPYCYNTLLVALLPMVLRPVMWRLHYSSSQRCGEHSLRPPR